MQRKRMSWILTLTTQRKTTRWKMRERSQKRKRLAVFSFLFSFFLFLFLFFPCLLVAQQRKKAGYVDPKAKKPGKKPAKGKGKAMDDDDDDEGRVKVRKKPGPKPKPKPVAAGKIALIKGGVMVPDDALEVPPAGKKARKKVTLMLPDSHDQDDDDEDAADVRKSRRQATVASTLETEKRQAEAVKKASHRAAYGARTKVEYVATQEEILEEAKETELWNLEVLKMYQQMELEKKVSSKKTVM
jgi:hypothetical protein